MNTRDEKLNVYLTKVQEFFPGIAVSSVSSFYNPSHHAEPHSGKIQLSGKFMNERALSNGNVQFIHYTSLRNAMSILNSGRIRLYNCFNLNDPSEIKWLLEKSPVEFSPGEIETFKQEHFILSGSIYKTEHDEDFNLWRLYGDNGAGVGIVFEVDERVHNWPTVYLQNISYSGDDHSMEYKYFKFHKDFDKQYQLFENKPDFFAILATGVKNSIWSIEREFRVVVNTKFDRHSLQPKEGIHTNALLSSTLQHEYKDDGRFVSFIELPLHLNGGKSNKFKLSYSQSEVDSTKYVPSLRVKKIIFGPNSKFKQISDISVYLSWLQKRLKYGFEVSSSKLQL
jgi:hypothetical protein